MSDGFYIVQLDGKTFQCVVVDNKLEYAHCDTVQEYDKLDAFMGKWFKGKVVKDV